METRPRIVRILYKSILRLHRGLPDDIRLLGDQYVKDEFKRHKKCSDAEAHLFLQEWSDYAFRLNEQLCIKSIKAGGYQRNLGAPIRPDVIDELRDDQVVQLYELKKATNKERDDGEDSTSKSGGGNLKEKG